MNFIVIANREVTVFRYGIILMVICLISALVLSVTYRFTQVKIRIQIVEEEMGALRQIFPAADDFKQDSMYGQDYYRAEADGKLIGYVVKVRAQGYASDIDMLVGVDSRGDITGIKVTKQNETPGLGAKIVEIKPGEEKPWFLRQFEGKKAKDLNLKNIDAITAATVTSKAIIKAIKEQITIFLFKLNEK
jgi:electron transport complex protein RnfG